MAKYYVNAGIRKNKINKEIARIWPGWTAVRTLGSGTDVWRSGNKWFYRSDRREKKDSSKNHYLSFGLYLDCRKAACNSIC